MTQQNIGQQPSFAQKFALKQYIFVVHIGLVVLVLQYTHNPVLAFFVTFIQGTYGNVGAIFGKDSQNDKFSRYHNSNFYHLGPLIINCFTTVAFLIYIWHMYDIFCSDWSRSIATFLVCGFQTSSNIDACHQLMHRNESYCRIICYLTLIVHQFTTYPIEHLYVHHKLVGTPEDPVTSPKNQSFYAYLIKVIWASYKVNYKYSKTIFTLCIAGNLFYIGIIYWASTVNGLTNWSKILYFISLSYFNILLMEGIQYVQHYGLVYRMDQGKTPVKEICSWNTEHNSVMNWAIFRYQRHSDHHMNPYKIYSTLDLNQKMPKFPFDFNTALFFSLMPWVWFYIANPLVDQVIEGKIVSKQHYQKIKRAMAIEGISLLLILTLWSWSSII